MARVNAAKSPRLFRERAREGDDRNDFQRDRDIILYSSALQRLSTTTQVVSGESGYVFHNRLTHTLQVAQVGRRLAEKLIKHQKSLADLHKVDPDVVEAACLAHDIGHPPFGHLAELELNNLVRGRRAVQGFEGNAQSFRIVTALAFRSEKFQGLNLTKRTLRAILKYPWTYSGRPKDKRNKWGAYNSELEHFQAAAGKAGQGPYPRSAEAELMDWADDLTYAIHDAEDFYRAGLIPLHLLRPAADPGAPNLGERERFLQYVAENRANIPELAVTSDAELSEILESILEAFFLLSAPYQGNREDRGKLRSFTSQLVNRYINGISLIPPSTDGRVVEADPNFRKEIALLKQLTWHYVIDAPGLALQQHAQRRIIRSLFDVFQNEAQEKTPSRLLPPYYQERLRGIGSTKDRPERVVIDLIAGMTESRAILTYRKLNGIEMPTGLDRTVL